MVTLLRHRPHSTAYIALILLSFFWGTTYLGIRMALESLPPAVLLSTRYLLSGGLMMVGARLSGAHLPRGRELWVTAALGVVILGAGNGLLVYTEQWVPSGLAALFLTSAPFWYAGADAVLPGGAPLHGPTLKGMLVGSVGVVMLAGPEAWQAFFAAPTSGMSLWSGFLLLQLGQVGWTSASLIQRRQPSRAHPFVTGAVQQLATGLVFAVPAAFSVSSVRWTPHAIWPVLYLAIFGGIVGYSCFNLVMARLPVAIATLYTYVNPVVAVILGWLFYREPFGWRQGIAMVIIFAGVALVRRASNRAASLPVQQPGTHGSAESGQKAEG